MATDVRHAATQDDKRFSVEVRTERGTVVVADALNEFLDAFDCAMEWLEREDPERTQSLAMGIFATRAGVTEKVWAYPAEPGEHAPEKTTSLVNVFGFDPVAWKPQAREFDVARIRPRHEPSPANFRSTFARVDASESSADADLEIDAAGPVEAEATAPGERLDARVALRDRLHVGDTFRSFWDDRVSRTWLILGAILLWLSVTLLAPEFLAPLLAVVLALWVGRGRRAAPTADTADDWF